MKKLKGLVSILLIICLGLFLCSCDSGSSSSGLSTNGLSSDTSTNSTNTNSTNTNSTNTNSTNTNSTNTNPNSTRITYPTPAPRAQSTCWICAGNGICSGCDGSGRFSVDMGSIGQTCRVCGGSGRCNSCKGAGIIK